MANNALVELNNSFKNSRWGSVEKLTLIRVGALGDLLVGTAALAEAALLFPKAKITLIGPKLWTEALSPKEFPAIERIAVVGKKDKRAEIYRPTLNEEWRHEGQENLSEIFRESQAVVNFNIDSYRYGFAAMKARTPIRVGSTPALMSWLYTDVSPYFGKDPEVHERDAALLILEYATPGAAKFLRTVERNRANLSEWVGRSRLVGKWRERGLPAGKIPNPQRAFEITGCTANTYTLINPTSSRKEKAWPAAKFREFLFATKKPGVEALVIGSPKETEWLNEVAGSEFRTVQPPTVRDLQDVLSYARGLVTNTSSVQFIAAMTGTPTITLMGRGNPAIWGPLGPRDQVIQGVPQPQLAHDIFKQEQAAYESIKVADVAAAYARLL